MQTAIDLTRLRGLLLAAALVLTCLTSLTDAVKHENFKTCDQSGFCKRNRAHADHALSSRSWKSPYEIDLQSDTPPGLNKGLFRAVVTKSLRSGEKIKLPLEITFLRTGSARVTVDEERRKKGDIVLRHNSKARKERYNEAASWAIVGDLANIDPTAIVDTKRSDVEKTTITYGDDKKLEAIIYHSPFSIEFKREGSTQVTFNSKGLLNYEHWRPKVDKPASSADSAETTAESQVEEKKDPEDDESTWWEESFGGNTDTKPRGPESVGMDITFPGYGHVYGLSEHTGPLSLKQTRGGDGNYNEPYRMYNADVFEYEMDSPMTLYGSIPFLQAQKKDSTVGVFWLNAAETWVDITKSTASANPLSLGINSETTTQTHWFSESGLLDVFVFLGPKPSDVLGAYANLTGYTALPNDFAIAYHQCRWNYVSDTDVRDVDKKFDKFNIPYDVIWLDLEYTHEKEYFTWDSDTFPDPLGMQDQLDEHGRKLVVIIDPHIKNNGYKIVEQLKSKKLATLDKDGNNYDGWCWPGSSHWIDAFNVKAREWWVNLFQYSQFALTRSNMFIWNDMNEPSVFNGPETTMPKDNLHHGGWEHRDVHNLNGMTFHNATYHALLHRNKEEEKRGGIRPFVLTRSFFSGSQRLGAMWTGDNQASWEHLGASFPMTLGLGISGFPFAGADVGGFFGNPERELLVRWYQTGIWSPFFRAHAHIDTRRREPYLLPDYERQIVTQAIRLRYSLLPSWYNAFHQASINGTPIIKPMYYVHPSDEKTFSIDDQLYLGSTGLLVKPVSTEGSNSVDIYLPTSTSYFDYFDYKIYKGPGKQTIPATLEQIPVLMTPGHIFPRRDRPRRSSGLMKRDPYTLVVVLPDNGDATGELYVDDGETFDYQLGASIWRRFDYDSTTSTLTSTNIGEEGKKTKEYLKSMRDVVVGKIVVVNPPKAWKGMTEAEVSKDGKVGKVGVAYTAGASGHADWAVIRGPSVAVGSDWKIIFA